MKNVFKFLTAFFFTSFMIFSCTVKDENNIHKVTIYPDTSYIQIAISNKDYIQFFTMLSADEVCKIFNDTVNKIFSKDEKNQINDFINIGSKLSPEKPWEYEVSCKDTTRINNIIEELKAKKNIIPLTCDFSWSFINQDTSKITLFAYLANNINKAGFLTSSDIIEAYKAYDENSNPILVISLKKERSKLLKRYTSEKIGKYFGLFIKNRFLLYRYVRNEIDGSEIII